MAKVKYTKRMLKPGRYEVCGVDLELSSWDTVQVVDEEGKLHLQVNNKFIADVTEYYAEKKAQKNDHGQ